MIKLTAGQVCFYETFGYLVLPGLMADSIGWITNEFETVFTDRGIVHDGTKRSSVVPFIDQRERLAGLLDDPRIEGLAASLLGDDFNYLGGDGNYYTGDTPWHSDDFHREGSFLKIAFYLDPVTRGTGALRVIPGSHRIDLRGAWAANEARNSRELWGIEMNEVPSVALESQPGDVVAFNHNLMHAAFGGSTVRRMFTLNMCRRADTEAEVTELKRYIEGSARFWIDSTYSDLMKTTASNARMVHLRQVLENEGHLPALAAKARLEMAEPSRN